MLECGPHLRPSDTMATAKPLRRGTKLGKYRLERKLGKGSFASVWKARDTVEKRPVALKIAFPELVEEWGGSRPNRIVHYLSTLVEKREHFRGSTCLDREPA